MKFPEFRKIIIGENLIKILIILINNGKEIWFSTKIIWKIKKTEAAKIRKGTNNKRKHNQNMENLHPRKIGK